MVNINSDKNIWIESLTALFEYATEGIIITNSDGQIIRANPSAELLFGYDKDALNEKIIEDLIPQRFKDKHVEHRHNFYHDPKPRAIGSKMCLWAKKKNGTEFPVEVSLTHYRKDQDSYVISFIVDITERKEHEENIKKLNLELEKKVNEKTQVLKEALLELESSKKQVTEALRKQKELNDMKSRFITLASHEFRTPLSSISSSISLIERYKKINDDEKHQRHVQRVRSAVTNIMLILSDFLSAERLNESLVTTDKTEFSLKDLANEIIEEMNNLLKPGQRIDYKHEGTETVLLDKQIMRNTLMNLISNAIKFSGENKKIEVLTKISGNETLIKVRDEGIGIPKEEYEHMFHRFFRARNAVNISGIGMGLSLIAKYIELLNGKIDFTSELDKGTTFTVAIPR